MSTDESFHPGQFMSLHTIILSLHSDVTIAMISAISSTKLDTVVIHCGR